MSEFVHFAKAITPIGQWLSNQMARQDCLLIRPYLKDKEAAILEIGPGLGFMAMQFQMTGYLNYTAVEPNTILRNLLSQKGITVKNYVVPPLIEQDATYDCIFMANVFEHMNNNRDAIKFVTEAQRVLRMGGILCISAPDYLAWRYDFFNSDYTHSNVTTVRRAMQIFYDTGFKPIKYWYLSGFISGMPAIVLSILVRLALAWVNTNNIDSKLFNFKLTFSRRFLIIGEKN